MLSFPVLEKKDMANGNVSEEDESKKDGEKEEKKEEQKMVGSLEIVSRA